jgi:predicted AAA+ superfamily ATPase
VVIDEVQKLPKLLDVVHSSIETRRVQFALTGSSARKLKAGGANMLAGRAFVYNLFPLTYQELGVDFDTLAAMHWGTLPRICSTSDDVERAQFLRAYANTYLKEEVWGEQLVRDLEPFRRFLTVAAQSNGKIIAWSKIARDVGVDDKTVKAYYSILEDTLVGTLLEPFQHSFRKRLAHKPKFYFFDTGVARALSRTLAVPLVPGTYAYGDTFEQLVTLEILRLSSYRCNDFRFSYLRTKDDVEVDLVIERPGRSTAFVEIKSSTLVPDDVINGLARLIADFPQSVTGYILCQEPQARMLKGIQILPWREGIEEILSAER